MLSIKDIILLVQTILLLLNFSPNDFSLVATARLERSLFFLAPVFVWLLDLLSPLTNAVVRLVTGTGSKVSNSVKSLLALASGTSTAAAYAKRVAVALVAALLAVAVGVLTIHRRRQGQAASRKGPSANAVPLAAGRNRWAALADEAPRVYQAPSIADSDDVPDYMMSESDDGSERDTDTDQAFAYHRGPAAYQPFPSPSPASSVPAPAPTAAPAQPAYFNYEVLGTVDVNASATVDETPVYYRAPPVRPPGGIPILADFPPADDTKSLLSLTGYYERNRVCPAHKRELLKCGACAPGDDGCTRACELDAMLADAQTARAEAQNVRAEAEQMVGLVMEYAEARWSELQAESDGVRLELGQQQMAMQALVHDHAVQQQAEVEMAERDLFLLNRNLAYVDRPTWANAVAEIQQEIGNMLASTIATPEDAEVVWGEALAKAVELDAQERRALEDAYAPEPAFYPGGVVDEWKAYDRVARPHIWSTIDQCLRDRVVAEASEMGMEIDG